MNNPAPEFDQTALLPQQLHTLGNITETARRLPFALVRIFLRRGRLELPASLVEHCVARFELIGQLLDFISSGIDLVLDNLTVLFLQKQLFMQGKSCQVLLYRFNIALLLEQLAGRLHDALKTLVVDCKNNGSARLGESLYRGLVRVRIQLFEAANDVICLLLVQCLAFLYIENLYQLLIGAIIQSPGFTNILHKTLSLIELAGILLHHLGEQQDRIVITILFYKAAGLIEPVLLLTPGAHLACYTEKQQKNEKN